MKTTGLTRSPGASGDPLQVYLRIRRLTVADAVPDAATLDLGGLQASLEQALAERLGTGAAADAAPPRQRPSLTQAVAGAVAARVAPSLNRTGGAERG